MPNFLLILSFLVLFLACNTPPKEDKTDQEIFEELIKSIAELKDSASNQNLEPVDPIIELVNSYQPSMDSIDIRLCAMSSTYQLKYYSKKKKKEIIEKFRELVKKGKGSNCICQTFSTRKTLGGRIPIVNTFVSKYKTTGSGLITPMHALARNGEIDLLKILIEDSADLNKPNSGLLYPIDMALMGNEKKMIDFLLKNGADPKLATLKFAKDLQIIEKMTQLGTDSSTVHVGFAIDSKKKLKKLLSYKPDLNKVQYNTFWWDRHLGNVKFLLENGLSPFAKEIGGHETILHHTVYNGDTELALLMLEFVDPKRDKEKLNKNGDHFTSSLIVKAAEGNDLTIVKKLIELGVELNVTSEPFDYSPLTAAISNNNIEMVELLVNNGAKTNFPKYRGYDNPVEYAITQKDTLLIKALKR